MSDVDQILEGALSLPEDEREALALRILDSVRASTISRDEVVSRIEQVRRGEVKTESWAEVEAHLDGAGPR